MGALLQMNTLDIAALQRGLPGALTSKLRHDR